MQRNTLWNVCSIVIWIGESVSSSITRREHIHNLYYNFYGTLLVYTTPSYPALSSLSFSGCCAHYALVSYMNIMRTLYTIIRLEKYYSRRATTKANEWPLDYYYRGNKLFTAEKVWQIWHNLCEFSSSKVKSGGWCDSYMRMNVFFSWLLHLKNDVIFLLGFIPMWK